MSHQKLVYEMENVYTYGETIVELIEVSLNDFRGENSWVFGMIQVLRKFLDFNWISLKILEEDFIQNFADGLKNSSRIRQWIFLTNSSRTHWQICQELTDEFIKILVKG